MKKYVKPELFYEHFELNQHIAACGWDMQEDGTALPNPGIFGPNYNETLYAALPCTITEDMIEDFCHENGSNPMGSTLIS